MNIELKNDKKPLNDQRPNEQWLNLRVYYEFFVLSRYLLAGLDGRGQFTSPRNKNLY